MADAKPKQIKEHFEKLKKGMHFSTCCWIAVAVALVVAVACKSTISVSDFFAGNGTIDWAVAKEIVYNLSLGLIASVLVALFVEHSNSRVLSERNKYVKRVVMRQFAGLVYKTLQELKSSSDCGFLSVTHNYHHLQVLIQKRAVPIRENCTDFMEKYNNVFEEDEIETLNDIVISVKQLEFCLKEDWKKRVLSSDRFLNRYYISKAYPDLPLNVQSPTDSVVLQQKEFLDDIVKLHEKDVGDFLTQIEKLQTIMPYIFKD